MSVIKYGTATLAQKPQTAIGYDVSVDATGAASAIVTTTMSATGFTLASLPKIGSKHPDFPTLTLWDTKASRENGALMKVTSTYKGVAMGNTRQLAVVEFNLACTQEPLLTHPKFAGMPDLAAGVTVNKPMINGGEVSMINLKLQNSVKYDKNDTFIVQANPVDGSLPVGFAVGDVKKSTQIGRLYFMLRKLGIESWLCPGGTYKQSYVDSYVGAEIYTGFGSIVPATRNPDVGGLKTVLGTIRNLLYNAVSWRIQGSLVTINQEYQMSGTGGWNIFLYGLPDGNDFSKLTAGDIKQAGADA